MVAGSLKNGSRVMSATAGPRSDLRPLALLVSPGELADPGRDGEPVGGIGERRRREPAEGLDQARAGACQPAEQPGQGEPPRLADDARVEAVHLGRRLVPD